MGNKKYLSEIIKGYKLDKNTLIVSPTGSGKTHYIINELCKNKKVLYLCDNSNLEEQVALEDNTRIVKKNKLKKGFNFTDIRIMTYKYFGTKIRYDIEDEYINSFKLIICDEIHNLIDYQTFNNDPDLSHAIKALMKKYDNTQILMFTATPYYLDELVYYNPGIDKYFTRIDFSNNNEIMRYFNKRKSYINHMSQIQFILEKHKASFENDNLKCLIYVDRIENMKYIEEMCIDRKLKPICIWSIHNAKNCMAIEQIEVREHLIKTGELKEPYNVLIINRATETGVNIYDEDMQLVVVNTTNITQQVQARGRVRHDIEHLVVKTKAENIIKSIAIEDSMLDKWLLKKDWQLLIEELNVRNDKGEVMSVNKFHKELSKIGYIINKTRMVVDGKKDTYYNVSGQKMELP